MHTSREGDSLPGEVASKLQQFQAVDAGFSGSMSIALKLSGGLLWRCR
jgi:hypothetical protein